MALIARVLNRIGTVLFLIAAAVYWWGMTQPGHPPPNAANALLFVPAGACFILSWIFKPAHGNSP